MTDWRSDEGGRKCLNEDGTGPICVRKIGGRLYAEVYMKMYIGWKDGQDEDLCWINSIHELPKVGGLNGLFCCDPASYAKVKVSIKILVCLNT